MVLPQDRASIALDSGFVAKMNSLFVSINPISPAERAPGPLFTFPIIRGGALAPDGSLGTLRSGGVMESLQLGAGQVLATEFWFDLGLSAGLAEIDVEPTPTYRGKLGQLDALTLGAAAVSSDPRSRTIKVGDIPLTLGVAMAAAFNEAFAGGEPVSGPKHRKAGTNWRVSAGTELLAACSRRGR